MRLRDQLAALLHPVRGQELRAAEDHGGCTLHLVEEEFAEVLHIHAALAGVHDGGAAADLDVRVAFLRLLHGGEDLAELAHAGGLHEDPVRVVGVDQLVDRGLEVARQGAADAAGVQLGHGDAGVLHEAAVDPDLAVFVLQQHHLFIPEAAGQQFFDKSGLSRSEKARDHVNFYHGCIPFPAASAANPLYSPSAALCQPFRRIYSRGTAVL